MPKPNEIKNYVRHFSKTLSDNMISREYNDLKLFVCGSVSSTLFERIKSLFKQHLNLIYAKEFLKVIMIQPNFKIIYLSNNSCVTWEYFIDEVE